MKNKMKSVAVLTLSASLLLTGCNSQASHDRKVSEMVAEMVAEEEANSINLAPYLELSKIKTERSNRMVNAMGAITNNYHEDIDKIGEIVFLGRDGIPIKVKAIHLQITAGETTYFEELIGIDDEPDVDRVVLIGFHS